MQQSRQLLALQEKAVGVCLREAAVCLDSSSSSACSDDTAAADSVAQAIATLHSAQSPLSDATALLTAMLTEAAEATATTASSSDQHNANASATAETESPMAGGAGAQGGLGALYPGSLSEALAAADTPAAATAGTGHSSGRDGSSSPTGATGSSSASSSASSWESELLHTLRRHEGRLLELCGDAAHTLLVLQRRAAAVSDSVDSSSSVTAAAASALAALTALLSSLPQPVQVSELDGCGEAHGCAWSSSVTTLQRRASKSKLKQQRADTSSSSGASDGDNSVQVLPCLLSCASTLRGLDTTVLQLALLKHACYQCAVSALAPAPLPTVLIAEAPLLKLGDACNELGQLTSSAARVYLAQPQASSTSSSSSSTSGDIVLQYAACLTAAESWFAAAGRAFRAAKEPCNSALVLLNLASIAKLRPRMGAFVSAAQPQQQQQQQQQPSSDELIQQQQQQQQQRSEEERCCEAAVELCSAAHCALGQRSTAPPLWDGISSELAMTWLTLGVRRRSQQQQQQQQQQLQQQTLQQVLVQLSFSNSERKRVREPLETALCIYSDLKDAKQVAAAHYQIGLYYSYELTALASLLASSQQQQSTSSSSSTNTSSAEVLAAATTALTSTAAATLAHLSAAATYFATFFDPASTTLLVVGLELAQVLTVTRDAKCGVSPASAQARHCSRCISALLLGGSALDKPAAAVAAAAAAAATPAAAEAAVSGASTTGSSSSSGTSSGRGNGSDGNRSEHPLVAKAWVALPGVALLLLQSCAAAAAAEKSSKGSQQQWQQLAAAAKVLYRASLLKSSGPATLSSLYKEWCSKANTTS
jgi:hypothetical protein